MRACVCARTCVHEYNIMWVSNVPGTYSSSGAHALSVTFCKEHFGMLCTAEKLCLIQKLLQSVQDFVRAYRGTGRHTDPKVVCAVFVMCGVLDIHSPCQSSVEVWSFIVFHSSSVIHYVHTYVHPFGESRLGPAWALDWLALFLLLPFHVQNETVLYINVRNRMNSIMWALNSVN